MTDGNNLSKVCVDCICLPICINKEGIQTIHHCKIMIETVEYRFNDVPSITGGQQFMSIYFEGLNRTYVFERKPDGSIYIHSSENGDTR